MRFVNTLATACALLGAGCAGLTPREAEVRSWHEPAEPLRIVGSIHFVGTEGLGAYLITTPEGHILLDGAVPDAAPAVEASIRKLGFKPEDIKFLLITHAHCDHAGNVAYFKRLSNAAIAVMEADAALLASGGKADYLYAADPTFHFPAATADRLLQDGDRIELGGVVLTARLTPGHTRGCTTWLANANEEGRSYFVVFPGSTSVNPGTRLVIDPSYPGIAEDYRRAVHTLELLEPDIWLPAHMMGFDLEGKRARAERDGARAFIDPDGYRHRIEKQKTALEELIAKEGIGAEKRPQP